MDRKKTRYLLSFLLLILLSFGFFILNIISGSSHISPGDILHIISGRGEDLSDIKIIKGIRLPRALAAFLLGGGLSVSGFLLQNFFRNPIAGPYVLGISSGSKLTVAAAMIFSLQHNFLLSSSMMVGAAFVGSLLSMGLILLLSGRIQNNAQLIIGGVMIGYICSALTELAVSFADDNNIVNLHNWSVGSFSAMKAEDVRVIALISLGGSLAAFLLSKPMSAFQLGEAYAKSFGVRILSFKTALIIISSILSACVTAFAGPVSFVGVAVPHLMRSLFATSRPLIIIPASFIGGGAFCLMCDLVARQLFSPTELGISTVTAIFGAPVVISVMFKRKRGSQ